MPAVPNEEEEESEAFCAPGEQLPFGRIPLISVVAKVNIAGVVNSAWCAPTVARALDMATSAPEWDDLIVSLESKSI
jgi:hypothetical protein